MRQSVLASILAIGLLAPGMALATDAASPAATPSPTATPAAQPSPAPSPTATPSPTPSPSATPSEKPNEAARRQRDHECSVKADAKHLHGEERKRFRAQCKKGL